jgi:hypothetical protein
MGPGLTRLRYSACYNAWEVPTDITSSPTSSPTAAPTATSNPTLTTASIWGFDSSMGNAVHRDGFWRVYEITYYSSPDCLATSKLDTSANNTESSGFYESDAVNWGPYNAFDSNPTSWWGNDPKTGYFIAYDFKEDVEVRCVELNQYESEYVTKAELWCVIVL